MNWPDAEKREVFLGPNLIFTPITKNAYRHPQKAEVKSYVVLLKYLHVKGDVIQI